MKRLLRCLISPDAVVLVATDERPVAIEICDVAEKINAFLPMLDEMMESGLVTLERGQVLRYGRKRSNYLERLKENMRRHLHIHDKPPGETASRAGPLDVPQPPRAA
jgi:hypothetical protein